MMFFEMPHFARELKHSIEKFNKIIHNNISSKKSEKYNQVKQMIEKSLREKEPFNIRTPQEARLGIAVLSLEPGMIGRVVQSNRLLDFLETALGASNRLAKSLLELYYHRYSVFENNISNKMYMTELLKKLIREYHGRNPMVIKAKQISSILDGKLNELLALYKDSDINEIKQDLYLNEEDEFYERLRLTKLLEGVRKLELGENNPSLFEQIYENRGISATETRNIGEESVSILLDKCKSANATISTEWIDFILKAVGDPRSPQTTYAWNRIGDELKNWMIG
ncbi:MAG: hypothetical protein IE889_08095, partial [Campylobacterales bacterium]|nr:hypothetical protein [Campylobacterales bacterium]